MNTNDLLINSCREKYGPFFMNAIKSAEQYEDVLFLVDALINDYSTYEKLIDALFFSISFYEDQFTVSDDVNKKEKNIEQLISSYDTATVTLSVILDQNLLTKHDLPEIGSAAHIESILSGKVRLQNHEIESLSCRFDVPLYMFF